MDVGRVVQDFIFLNSQKLATLNNGNALFFVMGDHLGSSDLVTDATGTATEYHDYRPYGTQALSQVTTDSKNTRTFTDKERDTESNLQYYGARYLSNGLARFSSVDPLALDPQALKPFLVEPQRLNSYSYAGGNPILNLDPDGRCFGPILIYCAAAMLLASNPAVVEGAWDALNAIASAIYFAQDPSGENAAYLSQDLAAVTSVGLVTGNGARRFMSVEPDSVRNQQASKFSRQADVVRLRHVTDSDYSKIMEGGFSRNQSRYFLNLDDSTGSYVSSFYSIKRQETGTDFGSIDVHLPKSVFDKLQSQKLIRTIQRESQGHGSYNEIIFEPGAIDEINKYIVRN